MAQYGGSCEMSAWSIIPWAPAWRPTILASVSVLSTPPLPLPPPGHHGNLHRRNLSSVNTSSITFLRGEWTPPGLCTFSAPVFCSICRERRASDPSRRACTWVRDSLLSSAHQILSFNAQKEIRRQAFCDIQRALGALKRACLHRAESPINQVQPRRSPAGRAGALHPAAFEKRKKNPTLILNKAPRPSSKQISPRTQFRLVGEPAPPNRTPAACALCAGAMVKPLGSLNQGYCKHVRGLSIFITRSAGEDTRTTSTVYLLTVRLARQKHSTSRR